MNRLTTDNPQNNFETMMNMVYGKDGWGYIRHGEEGMKITDFCFSLCKGRWCADIVEDYKNSSEEEKDELLCECAFNNCDVATIYAALCGYIHTRDRLKRYEDAGMIPPEVDDDEQD